jgi:hypothetical protein
MYFYFCWRGFGFAELVLLKQDSVVIRADYFMAPIANRRQRFG